MHKALAQVEAWRLGQTTGGKSTDDCADGAYDAKGADTDERRSRRRREESDDGHGRSRRRREDSDDGHNERRSGGGELPAATRDGREIRGSHSARNFIFEWTRLLLLMCALCVLQVEILDGGIGWNVTDGPGGCSHCDAAATIDRYSRTGSQTLDEPRPCFPLTCPAYEPLRGKLARGALQPEPCVA